jgi:hypothetical protein
MEILVELLMQALALLVQFILEMLVQIFAETLFELGIRGVADIFKRPPVVAEPQALSRPSSPCPRAA